MQKITLEETEKAAKNLKSNKAKGPDGLDNELLKYGGRELLLEYKSLMNEAIESNTALDVIGEGTLKALQKPNKANGPIENLRSIVLLNGAKNFCH